MSIVICNASLDERIDGYGKPQEVLRGTISPTSLRAIGVDIYQRKRHTPSTLTSIIKGFQERTPFLDIALGMRGVRFRDVDENNVELLDDVYVIDGYHRIVGALMTIEDDTEGKIPIRLGAQVFFNTTQEMERDWFKIWNTTRKSVSPSIIIRNERDHSRVAATLYGMSQTEKNFVLCDRVAWDDRPGKNAAGQDELVRGMMLLRVSGFLHGHKFGRSVSGGGDCLKLLARIERKVNRIGLPMLRQNLVTFFGTVESCWPFLEESVHARRLQMREPFLFMLARLLSDHEVFWKQPDEKELVVPARILHDLRRISLTDPNIMNLLHRGRAATDILYETVVHNLNKGRSTNRLVDRWKTGNGLPPKDDEDDDSEVAA